MSYVAQRKLNFQQLENALGTPLPAVIKGYATLRDAKLSENSYDKVVMWTGGGSRVRDLDTAKYGQNTLKRVSRRTARGRRFLRGRRDDDRVRWSDRHSRRVLPYR